MASNKWLSDLQLLKSTTNTLRGHLRDGGVAAYDNDTLQTLVGKVPSLAPIEMTDGWQPDTLWKFPDPNGSGELKTIREIWEEDSLASSYTYRSICQIIGDYDTTDLKTGLGTTSRTSADTFVLSDGTVYENITTDSLVHTWDKSKDIIDSKGRPMRYVRVYSNTNNYYLPHFNKTTVWCIFKMYSGSTNYSSNYVPTMPCECVEIYGLSTLSSFSFPYVLKKLIFNNGKFSGVIPIQLKSLAEVELNNVSAFSISGNSIYGNGFNVRLKNLTLPSNYTGTSFSLDGHILSDAPTIDTIDLGSATSITGGVTTKNCFIKKIIFPPNATRFTTQVMYMCEELLLPNTIETISINSIYGTKRITLSEGITTISTFQAVYDLEELIIPFGYNATGTLNLSSSSNMKHENLVNILENLADLTGQTAKTITFGSTNLAKLTDEEKAIATNKNWTLS